MSLAVRQAVTRAVEFQNAIAKGDLLNPALTSTDLVALLARAVLPADQGGLGYRLLLTAIRSDHRDDSELGPHGHSDGFAVDCWTQDNRDLADFLEDMAVSNKWVTKIGLGGVAQAQYNLLNWGGTIVFLDNASDHVHLQTQ